MTALLIDLAMRQIADAMRRGARSCGLGGDTYVIGCRRPMIALPDFLLANAELLWFLLDRPERLLWRPEWVARLSFERNDAMSTDALSDVLSAVHLSGSIFFDVTAKSPWVAEAPPAAQIAGDVTPGAQHVIEYHVVAQGSCWISLVSDSGFEPVRLEEGDIAVIPHGDAHVLSSTPGMRAQPNLEIHRRPSDVNALPFTLRTGGDGPDDARLICGFFSCDARPFNPLLEALPHFIRLGRDASQASHGLLDRFIGFATAEIANKRAGSQSVLNRISELLFVEVVRLHMDRLANNNTGWLAGLRDPLIGRALALLHARPAHSWTLEELASEAGASRSALADRFVHLVGYPPMQYLAQWRMQLAARRLSDRSISVAAVAYEVGYQSEAAFSRAFKKFVGQSPGQWRSVASGA